MPALAKIDISVRPPALVFLAFALGSGYTNILVPGNLEYISFTNSSVLFSRNSPKGRLFPHPR